MTGQHFFQTVSNSFTDIHIVQKTSYMYLMLHFTFINAWIVTLSRDPAFKFTLQSNLFKL